MALSPPKTLKILSHSCGSPANYVEETLGAANTFYSQRFESSCLLGRLYSHAAKAASKLAAARREADNPKDESTGVPLFAPQIGRAPNYSRNHAALPIGDYLYGMRCAVPYIPSQNLVPKSLRCAQLGFRVNPYGSPRAFEGVGLSIYMGCGANMLRSRSLNCMSTGTSVPKFISSSDGGNSLLSDPLAPGRIRNQAA